MAALAFTLIVIVLIPVVGYMLFVALDQVLGELYDDIERMKHWMHTRTVNVKNKIKRLGSAARER